MSAEGTSVRFSWFFNEKKNLKPDIQAKLKAKRPRLTLVMCWMWAPAHWNEFLKSQKTAHTNTGFGLRSGKTDQPKFKSSLFSTFSIFQIIQHAVCQSIHTSSFQNPEETKIFHGPGEGYFQIFCYMYYITASLLDINCILPSNHQVCPQFLKWKLLYRYTEPSNHTSAVHTTNCTN